MCRVMPLSPGWRGAGRRPEIQGSENVASRHAHRGALDRRFRGDDGGEPDGHATNAHPDISVRLGAGFFLERRDQILADA
jgi:hypothetical protein